MGIQKIIKQWAGQPWAIFAEETIRRFANNNGALSSAGLAFFVLLSLPPACLMVAALMSCVVKPSDAIMHVHGLLGDLLPQGDALSGFDRLLDARLSRTLANMAASSMLSFMFGFVALLWASMQMYVMGAMSMNIAFGAKENRGWLRLRLTALTLLMSTCALLSVSFWLTGVTQQIDEHPLVLFNGGFVAFAAVNIVSELLAVVLNAAMFALIYKVLPASYTSWRSAFVGGVLASVLFEISKKGLAIFLLRPNLGIYGGFANLIVFVLWVYYSTTILILGSEAAAVHARHSLSAPLPKINRRPQKNTTKTR